MKEVVYGAGVHPVALVLDEPCVIRGAGREVTRLTGVIRALAPVRFEGVALELGLALGDAELADVEVCGAPGHGCEVAGRLEARDVVFRRNGGAGLVVAGQAVVRGWLAEHNRGPGVLVFGEADLEGGLAIANGGDGIRFAGAARGVAYGNLCQGNLGHGVAIAGTAMPAVEHQTLRGNGGAGLACLDRCGGRIHANTCDGNTLAPMIQAPLARPMWGRNEGGLLKLGATCPSPSRRSRSSGR